MDTLANVLKVFSNESKDILNSNKSTASDIRSGVEILRTASNIVSDREENITKEETYVRIIFHNILGKDI